MVDTACLDKLLSIVTGLGVAEVADELADKPLDGECSYLWVKRRF